MTDPIHPAPPPPPSNSPPPPNANETRPAAPGPQPSAVGHEPSLRADPNRPADSGWREPAWIPPRPRVRDHRPSIVAIVVGLVLIVIGGYYFLDRTLGLAMPRIQWGSVWPIVLIVVGGLILIRSFQRKP